MCGGFQIIGDFPLNGIFSIDKRERVRTKIIRGDEYF